MEPFLYNVHVLYLNNANEYGSEFSGMIKLDQFIDLNTGNFLK